MFRIALSLLSLLFLTLLLRANDTIIVGHSALNRIYDFKKSLSFGYRPLIPNRFFKLDYPFSLYGHSLLKTKDRFFIRVEGTGRIYEVTGKRSDSLTICRIDSTIFFGYNGGAMGFAYNDTLYSFGGNGYWRVNGQLRFFSEKNREWEIHPVNEEVPAVNDCYFIDEKRNKLFYLQVPYEDPVTAKRINVHNVYQLDIPNKKNTLLGKLHPELMKHYPYTTEYLTVKIHSLNMQLLAIGGDKIYLLDFINNEVYFLSNSAIQKTVYGNSTGAYQDILFENNGLLYFSRSNDPTHQLDSIPISLKDFKKVGYRIYTPVSKLGNIYYLIIPGVVVLVLIAVIYSRRKSKEGKRIKIEQQFAMSDASDAIFKPMELELIQKIYAVSQLGKSYSVEDVNTALGLGKKSLEIQKKVRTDTLNRINHRYKMQFETQDDLIERVRSEEDRRYYRYFIREENMKKFVG